MESKTNQKELEILKFWQGHKIFEKTLEKKSSKGDFVFYEGPPTANAAPGVHHVLARAFKDVLPRYKTMQGFQVSRKAGWDTHGLPVELQVEKKLGIKSKPEIENIVPGNSEQSIIKFNAECKKTVWQFKDEWEKLTARIGFWLDMKNPYITYENEYIESVWAVIKKADERGLLYQGHKVVPFCTRCGTALSSHEVAQGYREVTEDSVYIKCQVTKGNKFVQTDDYILTWTTTPWTLPGNVALAVGPDVTYVRVKRFTGTFDSNNKPIYDNVILAKKIYQELEKQVGSILAEPFDLEFTEGYEGQNIHTQFGIVGEFKGKDLVGVSYEPLFPGAVDGKNNKTAWQVVPADFVTTIDGTGIVHTAVMYGEDDYNLGEKVGLPKQHTVSLEGKFLSHISELAGRHVKDEQTTKLIFQYLKDKGLLFKITPYKHDYPFCWRCDSPLLYYAKDSWFIKMTALQRDLLKNAKKINWVPSHIKDGRFGEWISGIKDWAISRERYWGTPLPIWICQTGNLKSQPRLPSPTAPARLRLRVNSLAGGQVSNLKSMDGCGAIKVIGSIMEIEKLSGKKIDDLHRPFIDQVTFACQCGGTMKRVAEVIDVWLDSGAMPFAQYHYPFANQKLIDKKQQFPADFISEAIDQTRGWFYTLLAVSTIMDKGPSYLNVICLGHVNDAKGQKMSKSKGNIISPWAVIEKNGADALRWYLFTINQPGDAKNFDIQGVTEANKKILILLENILSFYKLYASVNNVILSEMKNLSKKSRDSSPAAQNDMAKNVLDRWIIVRLNQLIELVSTQLDVYHIVEPARAIGKFVNELSTWYVRRSRERFKSGDATGVKTLGYVLLELSKLMAPFPPFIAEEVYRRVNGDKESVHLADWPASTKVSARQAKILDEMELARKIVEIAHSIRHDKQIKVRQPLSVLQYDGNPLSPEMYEIVKDEVNVKEVIKSKINWSDHISIPSGASGVFIGEADRSEFIAVSKGSSSVNFVLSLNTEITAELKLEGEMREIIRQINQLRKENGLTIQDKIVIYYSGLDKIFEKYGDEIKRAAMASQIKNETIDQMKKIVGGKIGIKKV